MVLHSLRFLLSVLVWGIGKATRGGEAVVFAPFDLLPWSFFTRRPAGAVEKDAADGFRYILN